jgi:AcrR family transcriptional regulator
MKHPRTLLRRVRLRGRDGNARLEQEIGLSRGAIFNYFPSKEALFVEFAVQDSARLSDLWTTAGLEAVIREVLELDPAWLGVYLELIRRVRTDADFRRRVEERQQEFVVNRARLEEAQRSGEFRDDLAEGDRRLRESRAERPRAPAGVGRRAAARGARGRAARGRYRRPSSFRYASAYTFVTRVTSAT